MLWLQSETPRPRLVRVVLCVLLLGAGLYVLHVSVGLFGRTAPHFWNHWIYDGVIGTAAITCLWRAAAIRTDRRAWVAIGIAISFYWLGDLYWNSFLAHLENPPYPSWADAGWICWYLPLYVGVMLLLRGRVHGLPASVWLEGIVGALALGSVGATAVFDPVVASTHGSFSTVATNLAYPTADVLLLAIIAGGFALLRHRLGASWVLLGAALLLFTLGDTVYLVRAAEGTYREGGWVDATWPLAMALIAVAAWTRNRPPSALTEQERPWVGRALGAVFGMLVVGELLLESVRKAPVVAHLLLVAAVVALLVRLLISARERTQLERTRIEARTDELTGLSNRRDFYEQAERGLAQGPAALVLLDLNHFKEINDALGHNSGDELLCLVGARLAETLPPDATCARLGGDEFVVLLRADHTEQRALAVAGRLRDALEAPFSIEGFHAPMPASLGVALAPAHAASRAELLRCADVAMYHAKRHETGIELYVAEGDVNTRDRLDLVTELREALWTNQLVLHYQPKVTIADSSLDGVEALVRWQHPRLGLLAPDKFVALAEQHGLIRPLTLAVIDQALAQQKAWRAAGREIPVAVNLSPVNLLDTRLPNDVLSLLDRHGVSASMLELEITEDTVMRDPERALNVLAMLSERGIQFALDDFGRGYSSLGQLKRLPVRVLKIDRSFVMQMTSSPEDAAIVRSTIELGRSLGLHTVAEGVETAEHLQRLAEYGCDTAQGYYLSRPIPADEFDRWLARAEATRLPSGA